MDREKEDQLIANEERMDGLVNQTQKEIFNLAMRHMSIDFVKDGFNKEEIVDYFIGLVKLWGFKEVA